MRKLAFENGGENLTFATIHTLEAMFPPVLGVVRLQLVVFGHEELRDL